MIVSWGTKMIPGLRRIQDACALLSRRRAPIHVDTLKRVLIAVDRPSAAGQGLAGKIEMTFHRKRNGG